MSAAAELVQAPADVARRFSPADLSTHGKWLLPRLITAYPHLNERSAAGWLSSIIFGNEYMVLYHEHAVGVAEIVSSHTLAPKPVVWERFVWAQDKTNEDHIAQAADFYELFHRWAKSIGAETIIVEEMSDVPHEMIKEKLGRVFQRQQQFARV
jgi:hypothetical protein